ncbi:MAG: ATP-binding protein [Clostridia bacterium]|nr:ATP-binding protein [Clostridia bacterium]
MQETNMMKIPKRILNALVSSMAAGVVPRAGAKYIAIGRTSEVTSLCRDLELVAEGGSVTRFVIGKYGSGKSFLIQLMRGYAVERGFVCADADLSPERRLSSSNGGGIATYRELVRNLSTKASPDGGALSQMISRWLSDIRYAVTESGVLPDTPQFEREVSARIYAVLHEIETGVGAFDFAHVIDRYYRAWREEDEETQSACLRWLRGEFGTKTQARAALSVSGIINDENWYDYIKLLAAFVRKIGYAGLVVFIDECVNLYKIPNRVSRENNYEKILAIFNDTLQGKATGLEVIFAGTPQFLEDTRRGLFSYEALRSRLQDNMFGGEAMATGAPLFGPIMRLARLSDDELLALLARVKGLFDRCYGAVDVTTEEMRDFLYHMLSREGAQTLITPRELIRGYITALGMIMQSGGRMRLPDIYKKEEHKIIFGENKPKPTDDFDPDLIEI